MKMTTRIIGTGSAFPEKMVTNDDLAKIVDTSDEWISSRTGIKTRYIATKEESCTGLAANAAKRALDDAQVSPEEIELIIVATCSGDSHFPNTACQVQKEIGAVNATAFDLSAACSGFLFALNTVQAYFSSGMYQKALIIGAEVLSRLVDWEDRSTCVLFGDGAGAAVVSREETGVLSFVQGANGSVGECLTCQNHILMDGQAVFKFAVTKVPECIQEVLEKSETEIEEVKYFILHQANSRILSSVARRLKMPEEKFPMNLQHYGNTSAASIPILLDEMNRQGKLERGDKLVLSGFGAGLTWGAVLIEW